MKGSGIYYYLKDESQALAGGTSLNVVVLMDTVKGSTKQLNVVTLTSLEDVIGYDLEYNPNYYALKQNLQILNKVLVLRTNKNPIVGNFYFTDLAGAASTLDTASSFDEVTVLGGVKFAAGLKTPGNWGDFSIKLDRNQVLTKSFVGNQTDEEIGTLANWDNKVASVTISETSTDTYSAIELKNGTTEYYAVKTETGFNIVPKAGGDSIGSVTITGNDFLLTNLTIEGTLDITIPESWATFKASFYKKEGNHYSLVEAVTTTGVNSVTANNFDLYFKDFNIETFAQKQTYIDLQSASNGNPGDADSIDLSLLDKQKFSFIVINGDVDIPVINKVFQKAESFMVPAFASAPAFDNFASLSNWGKTVYATPYGSIIAGRDIVPTEVGDIMPSPAMLYLGVYASMFNTYGNLNYPPAGYTTGNISITKLMDTDFDLYADELKTEKFNYLKVDESAIIWEQRTRNADESDLSYICSIFILQDLKNNILSFMKKKNFRFTTPEELLNIQTNLTTILNNFRDNNFLAAYSLEVPSYEEAAKTRENDIKIGVQLGKDGEVYNIYVTVRNDLI